MKPKLLSLENTSFELSNNSKNIEINVNLDEPKKLYKYYSLSDYSLKGLKKSTLYFSHSNLLNDVMDGNFMLWDMTKFIEKYKKDKCIKYELDNEIKKSILKQITKPFLECRGVLSLSDTYKNELLWAHYTNETGFCIELDTIKLKNNLYENNLENDYFFFPISYGKLKQIDFSEYINYEVEQKNSKFCSKKVNAMLPILYCFAQKDYTWKYENEWRILLRHKKFNSVSFPIDIINDEQKKTKTTENMVAILK